MWKGGENTYEQLPTISLETMGIRLPFSTFKNPNNSTFEALIDLKKGSKNRSLNASAAFQEYSLTNLD